MKIPQLGMRQAAGAHFVLLQLVAAEDDHLARGVLGQQHGGQLAAQRAGAPRYQNDLLRPIHGG